VSDAGDDDAALIPCPNCGRPTPSLDYCCRCGFPLAVESGAPRGGRKREQYAAAPNEGAWSAHVTSTLFPQLPRHDMGAFRLALAGGVGLIVVLGIAGVFAVALAAAAVLIPVLMVLYLYDVDVYEDESILVVGLTMLLSAAIGVAIGLVLLHVELPLQQHGWSSLTDSAVLVRAVVVPVIATVLALVGPLILLRHPRFNDVLDGVFFGAAAAVGVWAALMLVQAWPIAELGLRPDQASGPWTVRLVELSVLMPLVAAGGAAWAAGSLWLRFRAPVRDRRALGLLATPALAVLIAMALPTAATLAQQVFGSLASAVVLVVLAAVGLLLMRRAIHVGLLEEADERDLGPDVTCANCGRTTPTHTFCGHCGVALRALPKRPGQTVSAQSADGPRHRLPPGDQPSRRGRGVVLLAFWLSMSLICLGAVLVVVIQEPGSSPGACPPPQRCPGPPVDIPQSNYASWPSRQGSGAHLLYPAKVFSVDESTETTLRLQVRSEHPDDVEASLWVQVTPQADAQPEQLVQDRRSDLSSVVLGLTEDDDPATTITQLRIGRFDATGGSFRGTADTPVGPVRPAFVIIGAAGNGRTAVVFSYVITGTDDLSTIAQLRRYLSPVLTSVTWGS
jgi:hypothetical protein